jgi:hypothetical protein
MPATLCAKPMWPGPASPRRADGVSCCAPSASTTRLATNLEWLGIAEEDITHVINGEVWHDPTGEFTQIRATFDGYYPEPVRLRRIAHWCRYASGMGAYALKRAILRDNDYYANVTFTRAIRLDYAVGLSAGEDLLPVR